MTLVHPERRALLALFLFEASLVATAKTLHVKGERSIEVFLFSRPGIALLFFAALTLLAGTVLLKQYLGQRHHSSRHFRLMVMMNLMSVILMILQARSR